MSKSYFEQWDNTEPKEEAARRSRDHNYPKRGFAEVHRLFGKLSRNILNDIQAANIWSTRTRGIMIRLIGHQITRSTLIADHCYFKGVGLRTGGSVSINSKCHIDAAAEIFLDDGVGLACEVMLLTSDHDWGPPEHRYGAVRRKPISIGRGCWIGARATIMPGVTVAPGCVIAAGAIVTKDTEPNGIYAGVPARRIRDI